MGSTLKSSNCKILSNYKLKPIKGIYPYEYIRGNNFKDIINIMKEKSLPNHTEFYSTLKQSNISEEDYNIALTNWNNLKCKNIKDYTLKYLKIDVLILADLFENFRYMFKLLWY
jgi:hypothetical protein